MFWQFRRFGFRGLHGMGGPGPFAFIAKAGVELSDEQVEKLAEIKGDGFIDFAGRGADALPGVRSIIRALCKPDINKDEVRSLHKDLQAKRNQMGDAFIERIIAIAEVLTPEQRKQVRLYMLRSALGLNRHEEEHGCDDEPPRYGRRR